MKKISFPIDKRAWHPSLIPGVTVLISTYDEQGNPNIAPKSWVQMVSFEPSILMFSGTKNNTTEQNILTQKCFAINLVHSDILTKSYQSIQWYGKERIEKTGFTIEKSAFIDAPLLSECKANISCSLLDTQEVGSGFVIFGKIEAISIWDKILAAGSHEKYDLLDLVTYLEEDMFAKVNQSVLIQATKKEE